MVRTASWTPLCNVLLNQLAPGGGGVSMPCASASSMSRLLTSLANPKEGVDEGRGKGTVGFVDADGTCKDKVEFLGLIGPGLKSTLTLR